jgi:hypothetical protein
VDRPEQVVSAGLLRLAQAWSEVTDTEQRRVLS